MRARALIAPTAVAGLALAGGGAALAQSAPVATQLTIKSGKKAFSGKVKSSNPACVGGRGVSVFRNKGRKLIGSDASSANGKWKLGAGKAKKGKYYASTGQVVDPTGTVCAAAKSPVVTRTS